MREINHSFVRDLICTFLRIIKLLILILSQCHLFGQKYMRINLNVCVSCYMILISVYTVNALATHKQINHHDAEMRNYTAKTQKIHDSILPQYADLLLSITYNMQQDIELVRTRGTKSIRKKIGMKLLNQAQEKISNENLEKLLNVLKEFSTKERGILNILYDIHKHCSEEILSQSHTYNNKDIVSLLENKVYDYNNRDIRKLLIKIYGVTETLNIFKKHRFLNSSIYKQSDDYEKIMKQIRSNSPEKYTKYKIQQRNKIYNAIRLDISKIQRTATILKKALSELIIKHNNFKKANSEIDKQKKSFDVIAKTAHVNNILQYVIKIVMPYVMSNSDISTIKKINITDDIKDETDEIQVTDEELNALLEGSDDNVQIKEEDIEAWINGNEQARDKYITNGK